AFVVADRAGGTLQEFLDVAASGGRGVEKQDAAGFAARVLPSMRDVAREKRARAGPADGDLVADLEGDLAGEDPGDLVAVAVQMEQALGADGHSFLEQHDALVGLVADELQGGEAARRPHVEMLPTARGYDKACFRVHIDVLPCGYGAPPVASGHTSRSHARPTTSIWPAARAPDRSATRRERTFDGRMAETVYDNRSTSSAYLRTHRAASVAKPWPQAAGSNV